MESQENQQLTRLGCRLKLLRRQAGEWKTLLLNQKQVRGMVNEQLGVVPESNRKETLLVLMWITGRAERLTLLSIRHLVERRSLKARHQQEDVNLEATIRATNPI